MTKLTSFASCTHSWVLVEDATGEVALGRVFASERAALDALVEVYDPSVHQELSAVQLCELRAPITGTYAR